jgi:hypothetical protein
MTPPFMGALLFPASQQVVIAGRIRYAQLMRMFLILLGCIVISTAVAETRVYENVGPGGEVEYSDKPTSNAKPITVTPNVVTLPDVPKYSSSDQKGKQQDNQRSYTTVKITTPANEEAIRSNAGNFAATAEVVPEVSGGDSIQWLFDGQKVKGASTAFLTMVNVNRGTHTIQVQVVNADGEVLESSEPVTFHLLRVAVGK